VDYFARIDWGLAIIVGLVAGTIGLLINRFLQATADEFVTSVPFVGELLDRVLRARRKGPEALPWVCGTCRSLNPPSASGCYNGCGKREEIEIERIGEEPIGARAGRSRRRG
jgi:hypothetical protein